MLLMQCPSTTMFFFLMDHWHFCVFCHLILFWDLLYIFFSTVKFYQWLSSDVIRYMLHYIMVLFIVYFFVFGQCHSVMLILSHCIFFFFFSCLIVLFIMYVHHISPWFCSFIFWLENFFFFSFNACLRTNKFFKGGGSVVNHGSHTLFT